MIKTAALLIAVFISAASFAQTDFSGTWIIQGKEMITGPEYINALPRQVSIQQRKDSLIIESVSVGAEGKDVTGRQAYAMNGDKITITSTPGKRKFQKSLQWSDDKKILTLTTVFYIPENDNEIDFTRVEKWTTDGNELKVDKRSIETRSETWQIKGIFKKQ